MKNIMYKRLTNIKLEVARGDRYIDNSLYTIENYKIKINKYRSYNGRYNR